MSEAVVAQTPAVARPVVKPFLLVMTAIVGASLFLRGNGASADVSWLTDMCGRMLDGETGWIDIFETTPPVPTLLYMPGVMLGRVLGVSPELTVMASAYFVCFLALFLTDRFAPKHIAGVGPSRWALLAPATFFLFIVANGSFAQREHFAAALTLPILAIFIRRAEEGCWPPIGARLIGALCAGLAFAIKPPLFAFPFLALGLAELMRTRSCAFLFPSLLPVSAAAGLGLTALSVAAYPQYLDGVTTLMRDVYVPVRASLETLFDRKLFVGALIAFVTTFIFLRGRAGPSAVIYAFALAAGYVVAFAIQGKYFEYHALPAAMFVMIALVMALLPRFQIALAARPRAFSELGLGALAVCAACAFCFFGSKDILDKRGNLNWAAHYDRPTALAISPSIATSFPLAPRIGAKWIDRIHSQWVVHYARMMLKRDNVPAADKARYRRYFDKEIARVVTLIREERPDLIFQVDHPDVVWLTEAFLAQDPTLLDDYELVAERWPNRILRRKDSVRAPSAP